MHCALLRAVSVLLLLLAHARGHAAMRDVWRVGTNMLKAYMHGFFIDAQVCLLFSSAPSGADRDDTGQHAMATLPGFMLTVLLISPHAQRCCSPRCCSPRCCSQQTQRSCRHPTAPAPFFAAANC
eukprot:2760264-Rhodomonas_salina.1